MDIIYDYYVSSGIETNLIHSKVKKLSEYPEIKAEFEYWILNKKYKDNAIVIEGYTAESISKMSRYMNGEGAFFMLIELQTNKDAAMKIINEGFTYK